MIAVIDGCGYNLTSVTNALARLDCQFVITVDPRVIQSADKIILPGVGCANNAMRHLQKSNLVATIRNLTQPFLGICLGMQLLFEYSQEDDVACLNIIPGTIAKIPASSQFPVPHMGWNRIKIVQSNPMLDELSDDYFYFVHSYYAPVSPNTLAVTHYQNNFSAVVSQRNFYGTQFHPEKSGHIGLKLLNNFVSKL